MMVCWRVHLEPEIWTLFGFRKWKAEMDDGVVYSDPEADTTGKPPNNCAAHKS
jgi:hypothetical protein